MAAYGFLTTSLLDVPREAVRDVIYDAAHWLAGVVPRRAHVDIADAG